MKHDYLLTPQQHELLADIQSSGIVTQVAVVTYGVLVNGAMKLYPATDVYVLFNAGYLELATQNRKGGLSFILTDEGLNVIAYE